jgi:hypothetical protein
MNSNDTIVAESRENGESHRLEKGIVKQERYDIAEYQGSGSTPCSESDSESGKKNTTLSPGKFISLAEPIIIICFTAGTVDDRESS